MYTLLSAYHSHRRGKIMKTVIELTLLSYLFAVNVLITTGCPQVPGEAKAAYKAGESLNRQFPPLTLGTIKKKLKQAGVFDAKTANLNRRERKELAKLFDALEIMISSRARQPTSAQSMLYSLSIVQNAIKKSLKEGRISESLAAKFDWKKFKRSNRQRRDKPQYYLDKKTNMRVFNTK